MIGAFVVALWLVAGGAAVLYLLPRDEVEPAEGAALAGALGITVAVVFTLARLLPAGVPGAASEASRATIHGKSNPFPAEITTSLRITGRGSSKDTRHLELSLEGSGLSYEPGDALGIVPRNRPEQVEELLGALGWSLTPDQVARLDKASAVTPPYPYYPYYRLPDFARLNPPAV